MKLYPARERMYREQERARAQDEILHARSIMRAFPELTYGQALRVAVDRARLGLVRAVR